MVDQVRGSRPVSGHAPYRQSKLSREDASSAEGGEEAVTVRPYCEKEGVQRVVRGLL